MNVVATLNKKEENAILNVVSDMVGKRICLTESKSYEGKWGIVLITPTVEGLIVNANIQSICVVDVIDLVTDLFKDLKNWVTKYAEDLMVFCDKWGNELKRTKDEETTEE